MPSWFPLCFTCLCLKFICILRISYRYTYSWIILIPHCPLRLFPDPPSRSLSSFVFFSPALVLSLYFLMDSTLSSKKKCYPYVHQCRVCHPLEYGQLNQDPFLGKRRTFHVSSRQLPIGHQCGGRMLQSLSPSMWEWWLTWSCAALMHWVCEYNGPLAYTRHGFMTLVFNLHFLSPPLSWGSLTHWKSG